MKKHAKKALAHDIEVLGKTVPTLAVAAVLLAATGAGAVLATYGTVSGTATVNQAVTLDGQSDNTQITASYDGATVSGGAEVVSSDHRVRNTADEPADVVFETAVNGNSQSSVNGVRTSHLVSLHFDSDNSSGDGTYDVDVNPVTGGSTGDYAVHYTSGGSATVDYATTFYTHTDFSGDEVLKFHSETGSSHDAGGTVDEIWLVTSTGEKLVGHTNQDDGSSSVSVDLSKMTFYNSDGETVTPDWTNVVLVGIGFGDASAISKDSGSTATIDVTVDDVRVGTDSSGYTQIDEMKDTESVVLQTPTYSSSDSRYEFQTVTDFQINVQPKDYTVTTSVVPPSELQP